VEAETKSTSTDSDCSISLNSDDNLQIKAPDEGTAKIKLNVTDENGTQLRQITPASIQVVSGDSVPEPSEVADEEIHPSDTFQANGSQYIEYRFRPNNDTFPGGEDQGVVLYRTDETNALEPYSNLDLNTEATRLADADNDRQWTNLVPDPDKSPSYNGDERVDANQTELAGVLMSEDNNQDPERVGSINLTGWGDGGSAIEWTEGWNPVVFRVTDDDGDPLENGLSDSSFEVSLKLVERNATQTSEDGNITNIYEFGTQSDTVKARYLGGGYLAADIYLPNDLNDVGSQILADHPMDGRATVEMEAWALHLAVSRGESTDGDDLTGDAYWSLDDLGMIPAGDNAITNAPQNGTGGDSAITDVEPTAVTSTTLDEDRRSEDTNLHVATKFANGPFYPDAGGDDQAWKTGPGIHDYSVFLLEEQDQQQSSSTTIDGQETAANVHKHTFSPFSDATLELQLLPQDRQDAPGATTLTLSENGTAQGEFSEILGLGDTGGDFQWISQLTVSRDSNTLVKTSPKVIEQDQRRQALSNGIPMPLGSDDNQLFETEDTLNPRTIFDTRAIPGFVPDRGNFGIGAAVTEGEGFLLDLDDDEETLFQVEGQALVGLDESQLPPQAEENIPVDLDLEPTGPVDSITVRLKHDGSTRQTTSLFDDDGDGVWSGQLDGISLGGDSEATFRLVVTAEDIAGGETIVSTDLSVSPDQPPRINVIRPSEQDGARVMQPNGTIRLGVTDASLSGAGPSEAADVITVEEETGDSADTSGSPLVGDRINVTGIDSKVTPGTRSITVNVQNDTGEPSIGEVNVSLSNVQFNKTLDADGNTTGDVTFPDSDAGSTVTLAIEYNDTRDTNDTTETFDVDVVDTSGGFSAVPDSELEYSCENATCEVTHSPSGLSDGDNQTIRVTATDAADNTNTQRVSVEIDGSSPAATITVGDGQGTEPIGVGSDTTVEVEAADDFGIQSATLFGDGASVSFAGGSGTATISELALSGDTSTLAFRVIDRAGNEVNVTKEVRLDGEAPSIGPVTVTQSGDSQLSVSLTASDNVAVTNVRLSVRNADGATFSTTPMTKQQGNWVATINCPEDDPMRYFVEAEDGAGNLAEKGNRNNPQAAQLPADACSSEPELGITIEQPASGATVSGSIDVSLSANPPIGSGTEIQRLVVIDSQGNEQPVNATGASATIDTSQLADGEATLEVDATAKGERFPDTVTFTVNNRVPVDHQQVGDEIRLCASAQGVPDDVTTATIRIESNGDIVEELEVSRGEGQFCGTTTLNEGTYSGTLAYTDANGTESEQSIEVFTIGQAAGADKPTVVFGVALALGVITIGASAFAAFGRWS
jgi:hypothetical protein